MPAFEERLDSLDNDEISEPFETQFGWHIVQLIDRRQRDSAEDIARNQARQAIRQRKVGEEYEDWLRRQRAEAYVELRAEPTITQNDASTATES